MVIRDPMDAIYVKKTPYIQINHTFPYPGFHSKIFGQFTSNFFGYHPLRAGCIPYTYQNGHFHFFLSLGRNGGDLGDFGGGISRKETTVEGALRECLEESAGIFCFDIHQVVQNSFIMYSDEIAILFIPIHASHLTMDIKSIFQKRVEVLQNILNAKNIELDAWTRMKGVDNKMEKVTELYYEIEVLKSMLEKEGIEIVRDDVLFHHLHSNLSYNGRRFYSVIHNFLLRTKKLLYRYLTSDYIPTTQFSYHKVLLDAQKVFSNRKVRLLERKIVDACR